MRDRAVTVDAPCPLADERVRARPSAVVLLHGWGMASAVFEPLERALSADRRVQALDLPGYGAQPRCEPYTLERVADALAVAAPERCAVIGWSLGAQVALAWAHARPEQVARLVLIAATPRFVRQPGWDTAVDAVLLLDFAQALRVDPGAALLRFMGLQAHGEPRARRVIEDLRLRVQRCRAPSAETLLDSLNILLETDLRAALPAVAQRTLVIHGRHDAVTPLAAGAFLARTLPRARLAVIEDAAHAPFLSQVDAVASLIAEHLDA